MKENLNDLRAFLVVAQQGSFTKAARQMGVSPSALSHSIRGVEERLQVKLFNRTTRSVSTTDAGERLYQRLLPLFDGIDREVDALSEVRDAVRGKVRINGTRHVFDHVLRERIGRFVQTHPEIEVELMGDSRFVDIVADRFDFGIRLGDDVEKDMIAVRVSPDMRMCVVATPAYLTAHGTPQTPADLVHHECIRMLLADGSALVWEFADPAQPGRVAKVQPQGRLASNLEGCLRSALQHGQGLLWTPQDTVADLLAAGEVVSVLEDWAISYPGYHLYYPNRHHQSPVFRAVVEALRYAG
ncbi:LysR family transcriptional regulator [Lautropia dentalis]|uniref:LysR family transcriptional regulator n=1 Tax=Lautropia dentalis TaxID=2490857 RepID=A0A3R8T0I9_9BURK|nr:LysR family transcriptional regulator [Lautropia dentalis]RRN43663.1 LysR family transcriptional regulator [Lautropia dentalis]